MNCKKCGAALGADAQFCTNCGASTNAQADATSQDARLVCANCGATLEPGSAFCTDCGACVADMANPNVAATTVLPDTSGIDVATSPAPTPVAASAATYAAPAAAAPTAVMPRIPNSGTAYPSAAQPTYAQPAPQKNATSRGILIGAGLAVIVLAAVLGGFLGARALSDNSHKGAQDALTPTAAEGDTNPQPSVQTPQADQQGGSRTDPQAANGASPDQPGEPSSTQDAANATPAVPSLVGLSLDQALQAILDAGLSHGDVALQHSDTVGEGMVISQQPSQGSSSAAGTPVSLVVSSGPAPHRYEFVAQAMTWTEARSFAESRGGTLACVTSTEEWSKVLDVIPDGDVAVVWLGGFRTASGSFGWASAEQWGYSAWAAGEPNNEGGVEDYLCAFRVNGQWAWYDTPNDLGPTYASNRMGLVIEYDE